ncbi:hypothetical protein BOTBODRAFT_448765 [Botryobasidium botryosum FD-172 SS1]|uniref:Uncharacterized protein n=1 Tax=Botryobasidium botryosum (strain FD-172 SS1) TaxID=930990 RepID=A0A067MAE7_BOTB1|nr:hypothetical protein BOTBODRAFT_448765 [Botryobasidium botryosum FD-172 SS1]
MSSNPRSPHQMSDPVAEQAAPHAPTGDTGVDSPRDAPKPTVANATSPASRWIPPSLAHFSNASTLSSVPPSPDSAARFGDVTVPLPPVRPSAEEGEERDSYQVSPSWPYHPSQWQGPLPGPGLAESSEPAKQPPGDSDGQTDTQPSKL